MGKNVQSANLVRWIPNFGGFMKTELLFLLLTAVLTGLLWIPVVVGYVLSRGLLKAEDYKVAPTSPLPAWVNRANRAHVNAVENFAQFAAVVLVAQLVGVSTYVTECCAVIYFIARAAHAVVHISGAGFLMARTILFTIGWIAFITYAVAVLQKAF